MGKVNYNLSARMSKQGFFSHFGEMCSYSLRSLLSHPWMLTFLFVVNVAFVFLFSFYNQPIGMKINYTMDLISSLFQSIVSAIDVPGFLSMANGTTLSGVILHEPLFQRLISDIILLFILLAVTMYVVYTFFQSTSVRLIGWMVIDKKPFSVWQFIKLNLLWFSVYLVLRILILIADFIFTFVTNGKSNLMGLTGLDFLYVVVHVILFYLVFISYTFVGRYSSWKSVKMSFRTGFSPSTMFYYLLNYLPFLLYLVPFTKATIIVPIVNLLPAWSGFGLALQLIILYFFYIFFVAMTFTITHEVVLENTNSGSSRNKSSERA